MNFFINEIKLERKISIITQILYYFKSLKKFHILIKLLQLKLV